MSYKPIDLSLFPASREQGLRELYRYNRFSEMWYRPNLWIHTHRLLWLLEELLPLVQKVFPTFDPEKARILALTHDDTEMITGDMPAHQKILLSGTALADHDRRELEAIESLSSQYPAHVHGYLYKDLLLDAHKWQSLEGKLVSYLDKVEACCETLHEIFAGNLVLLWSVFHYSKELGRMGQKFPELTPLLGHKDHPLANLNGLASSDRTDRQLYKHLGQPHTRRTLEKKTDFEFYDIWKKVTIDHGQIDWLMYRSERVFM